MLCFIKNFFFCLVKSINLSCLLCPSHTLPVPALHSWMSSGPWMAHCYIHSSVAMWADAMSSSISGPCKWLQARTEYEAVNYIPRTHKHSAQLNFRGLGHHWRSMACPLFFFPCFFCLNEDLQGWGPVAPDSGLVGEIMNDQLGFELITLVYLGSTACWLRGSTDKKLSSIAQPDLFWSLWYHDPPSDWWRSLKESDKNLDFWNVCTHNGGK